MTEFIRRESDIRPALDMRLSGVTANPLLRMRVLSAVKEHRTGRKKLSAGLILALALTLLALGALAAALLTPRQLIDKTGVPLATENEGAQFTVQETNLLLSLAEENGIALSARARESIDRFLAAGEGYYKDEMLRALAKAEFGESMSDWTLAEQKWFDDVCVAIGFLAQPEKGLPTENDMTEARAVELAAAHIAQAFGCAEDLNDPALFRRTVQFLNGDADGQFAGMYYAVTYDPLTLAGAEYWVYVSASGDILDASERSNIASGALLAEIVFRYEQVFGGYIWTWSPAQLRQFQLAAANAIEANDIGKACILKTVYPDAPKGAITAARAGEIAAEAFGLPAAAYGHAVLIGAAPHPVWRVCLYDETRSQHDTRRYAEVDCVTGEITYLMPDSDVLIKWYYDLTTQTIIEEATAEIEAIIIATSVG